MILARQSTIDNAYRIRQAQEQRSVQAMGLLSAI
jgi:hypothetical protein